jgi:hypothetical protein
MPRTPRRTEAAAAQKKRLDKLNSTVAKTTVAKTVAKEIGKKAKLIQAARAKAKEKPAKKSGRSAAFRAAKQTTRKKRKTLEDVLEDEEFVFSGEERDAISDMLEPPGQETTVIVPDVPTTPDKMVVDKTLPLFMTPSGGQEFIHVRVEISYQSFMAGNKCRTATVIKVCGLANETAFALVGNDRIYECTGLDWNTGLRSGTTTKNLPAWPDLEALLRGMSFKRLKGDAPSVPLSLYMGLRELNDMYGGDLKRVAAKLQVTS